jgi:hypothetical protein
MEYKKVIPVFFALFLMMSLVGTVSLIGISTPTVAALGGFKVLTPQTASADPSPESFTIIVLPDTQKYSQSYPAIFENQTQWIIQNKNKENIVFVAHMGDIVETASDVSQWQNAYNAMKTLDNQVPYGILPGNHDLQDGGTNYSTYFPASRYEDYPYWGGSYSNNKNNYQLFSVDGMDFIALNLQYDPPTDVLVWANDVLYKYSDRRAIISTHGYLNVDGSRMDIGNRIWEAVVVPNNNVFLVLCGHNHGEARRSDNLQNNRVVHQILADYQDYSNGGNGYLRIMRFVPSENKIYVRTYSPYLDQYETDSDSQFELTYLGAPADSGWLYRRQITISPLNPMDYQIKVVIPSDIPKSDYPSIRFLENKNSGLLPYWIETNEDSYSNVAWVRRFENFDGTIWMYYGNPNVLSASNGDTTFIFFDDFGGGNGGQSALNKAKWDPSSTGVDVYQYTLRLEDYADTTGRVYHGPGQGLTTEEQNTRRVIECRIKNASTWRGGIRLNGPGWGSKEMLGIYKDGSGNRRMFSDGKWGSVNLASDSWWIATLTFYDGDGSGKSRIKPSLYYGQGASYRQHVETLSDFKGDWAPDKGGWYFNEYRLTVWDGGGTSSYYFDWFFVRKTVLVKGTETEPSVVVGEEEVIDTEPPEAPDLIAPENGEKILDNTPTLEWNAVSDPSGVTYRIQIDDSEDFSSPVYDVDGLTETTFTVPDELELFVKYYWHVRAIDGMNNVGNWSEGWNFAVVPIGAIGVGLMPLVMLLPFALLLRRQNRRYRH